MHVWIYKAWSSKAMHETPPPHPKSKLELESCEQTGLIGFIFIFLFCCIQTEHYLLSECAKDFVWYYISRSGIQMKVHTLTLVKVSTYYFPTYWGLLYYQETRRIAPFCFSIYISQKTFWIFLIPWYLTFF